jgi:parallel beta-helix repeat protein
MRALSKITLAIGILCIFALAQTTPKAAVYIMGNPEGRDALRMAVNNFLIKSQKYQMIAVDAIDVVAKEQNRQKSGSVSDGDIALLGRDAGAEYVCVVERSEFDGISYVATRMVSVQSKVAELADMTELPRGGKIIDMIQWQIGSMLGMPVGPRPKADSSAQANYAQPVYAAQTQQAVPTIQGTLVPGATLAEKLTWLQRSADSHNTYVLEVSADENIAPHTFEYKGAINITIVLRGVGGNRVIRLKSHGNMFEVRSNITFVLDNNITLQGHSGNTNPLVKINGGIFKMNSGSTITDNTSSFWEGISGGGGGGVGIHYSGTFEMTGGTISGNTAKNGGGVSLTGGTFTMSGGTISNNTASGNGGGIYLGGGTFTMRGGIITGNIAASAGGGVWNGYRKTFTKTGGTITGYNSDQNNGNVVNDGSGAMARKGHAVYYNENKRKETTAGPGANFSTKDNVGAWDE